MSRANKNSLALLDLDRPRSAEEDRALTGACQRALANYRATVRSGKATRAMRANARRALLHLGGDPNRSSASLKDYDHHRYGPFLGISDEGSAAHQIRDAAYESPKVRALPRNALCTPLVVGVAVDAERLGGVGEVAVGPEEYADVWLESVDRVLITTNIGTRVNIRTYRREPLVVINSDTFDAIADAKCQIASAFKPFVETPDGRPRPLTVFVEIPRRAKKRIRRERAALKELVEYVASGKAAGGGRKRAPAGQALGLWVRARSGPRGRDETVAAIDLAAHVGMKVIVVEGVKRRDADRAVSLAGLLDYFPPGLVGPILRAGQKKDVRVRTANLPDTDTMARTTWVGLNTARSYGANLGKYGCFPLTRQETDHVVQQIQAWLKDWSAAPVFFVDQGLLREGHIDIGRDLYRGLKSWLETVAAHNVPVVLIDTVDKASGKRLLKKSAQDSDGFIGKNQLRNTESLARTFGIKVLWAGGLGLHDAFTMGQLGVFGIYVTSAAATTIAVSGTYVRDPSLAGVKEPSKEAVLRTKILLEAGFLSARLPSQISVRIAGLAHAVLAAHDSRDAAIMEKHTAALATICIEGWREHWNNLQPKS